MTSCRRTGACRWLRPHFYDCVMVAPGQRIGYDGPSCLGMLGLLVVAVLIVFGGAFYVAFRLGVLTQNVAGIDEGSILHSWCSAGLPHRGHSG